MIGPGQTTNVYLDGNFDAPEASLDSYLTLPDGEIIGWRAKGSPAR